MGRPDWLRRRLERLGERSLLALPGTTVLRDLEAAAPADSGRGRRPQRPWHGLALGRLALPEEAWTTIDVGDGAKGPLVVALVTRRVVARPPQRQEGHEALLVGRRSRLRDTAQVVQVDWDLSKGAAATSRGAVARVATATQRLEAGLRRSKSETGWADYEGRHGTGWPHQHTRSFLATWFFVTATRRGKTMDPCDDGAPDPRRHRVEPAPCVSMRDAVTRAA